VKAGWQIKTLNEVCIVERGSSPRPIKNFFTDDPDGVNWIKISDTEQDGRYVYSTAQKITSEGAKQSRFVKEGDFILTNSMSFGRPYIMKISGYIHDGWFVLRLKETLDTDYFYYLLSSPLVQDQFKNLASGTIVKNISGDLVKKTKLPIPTLTEQHRIVAILDEAFDGIATAKANAEKNLKNARALFESHLQAMFSQTSKNWEKKHLAEVAKDFGRGKSKHRPRNDPKLYGGKYPFIQTGDVRNATHLINTYSQTYNEVGLAQSKLWPKGTLCITIAANIAETGILDFDSCFPYSVIGVVVDPDVISIKFLEYLLQSFKTILQAKGKGSAQDNINLGTFENQLFPFPSLKEQEQIVSTLDSLSGEIQRLESIYQQKLAALDELKKSLLHQAFSGQL